MGQPGQIQLRNNEGLRKYINIQEREVYRKTALSFDDLERLFFMLLYWTGVRISEGINVCVMDIELDTKQVAIRTLKKRNGAIEYRYIPLPDDFLQELDKYFNLSRRQKDSKECRQLLWTWSRTTAFRRVSEIMFKAKIVGIHGCAKGLRHSFGISCASAGVPTRVIQDLMGHKDVKTTEVYTKFVGKEKREQVSRIWETS